jgi:hypothetical protein
LQSNEKTFKYQKFYSVAEARAVFSKYEETFHKLGISSVAGGRQDKSGLGAYLTLTKDHSKVIEWNKDKVREITKKIKSLETL